MHSTKNNILIKGGYVIDPVQSISGIADVLIQDGVISCVEEEIVDTSTRLPADYYVYDATGLLVTPGLIDAHVHAYQHATKLGINADERCFRNGCTTVFDAGSAGAATFKGLKEFTMKPAQTDIKAFLHIANHGLASAGCASLETGGESDSLNQLSVQQCVDCIKEHPHDIVGIKVRLSSSVCNDGQNEEEVYRRALAASKEIGKPLMVHHAISSIPTTTSANESAIESGLSCPGDLQKGDIYTHAYHSFIIKDGKIDPAFLEARRRGVLFDVGHGMGGFSWRNAEICAAERFWPDMISTDLHTYSCDGPAYDLVTVMSKFLHLGMSLEDIVAAVTVNPAKAVDIHEQKGTLRKGMAADLTLMKIADCSIEMEDCHGVKRCMKRRFEPINVFKSGVRYNCV